MIKNFINYRPTLFNPIVATLLVASIGTPNLDAAQPKHVSVSPENFSEQKLPSPNSKGLFSHSTMLPVYDSNSPVNLSKNQSNPQSLKYQLYFDGAADTPLVFIGPNSAQWLFTVTDPSGNQIINELDNPKSKLLVRSIQMGQQSFEGKQLMLSSSTAGMYQINLTRQISKSEQNSNLKSSNPTQPAGFLLLKGDPSYKLYSYLDNNLTVQDNNINIVAYMVDSTTNKDNRQQMLDTKPLNNSITSAFATITSPSKKQMTILLRDDGLKGDQFAGDGLFSAKVPTSEIGVYTSQVQIEGIRPDGIHYSRTATDIYPIEKRSFRFTKDAAQLTLNKGTSGYISVPVKHLGNGEDVYLAAEVWGINAQGIPQSAAWIGGIVSPSQSEDGSRLSLSFDTRWMTRNSLQAPFRLKSLRLQTISNNVPIAKLAELPLKTSQRFNNSLKDRLLTSNLKNSGSTRLAITPDMLMANAPISLGLQTKASSGTKLLLVHGYCSGNVWNTNSFTNSAEFQDYDQSRSHEDFAQRIMDFGAPYSSYGIVAHSQGGAAALHIYARYWSGLDYANGGRIIQSVGTPYQGTALAGNLAAIGAVFGVGCGANTDLTYSGAANWLSTIPSWARAQVDYYTTSFTTKWWRYDYCHLATDLFLDDPEDGTTEKWSGQLSGAINMGHKKGWCHTTGMRDSAQYYDSGRNSSMNSRAAR